MTEPTKQAPDDRVFRQTLVRVMAVQVAALIALWLLQQHFSI